MTYCFEFVNLAVRYLETGDEGCLRGLAELDAARHIFAHASYCKYDSSISTPLGLVTHLLSNRDKLRKSVPGILRNIDFVKEHVMKNDSSQRIALECLPKGFAHTGKLFFTVAYMDGVAFGKNCSLNLAYPIYVEHPDELAFWAVHEIHHAGFLELQKGKLPIFDMKTFGDMAKFIACMLQLEGMGTYAALALRESRNSLDKYGDYENLKNPQRMKELESLFFEFYEPYSGDPSRLLSDDDWQEFFRASEYRMQYTVGAKMAQAIDQRMGREALTGLILQAPEVFIATYQNL